MIADVRNAPEASNRLTSESEKVLTSPPGWANRFWGSKSPNVCGIREYDDAESDAIAKGNEEIRGFAEKIKEKEREYTFNG
jgi:hypothetical protein